MRDKIAPPAGPDSTSLMGNVLAVSNVVIPPLDIIKRSGAENPCCTRAAPKFSRYVFISGKM